MAGERPPCVAVVNSSEDIVEALREILEEHGFETVTAHIAHLRRGRQDFLGLLEQHDPTVIVYDISPPYEENWRFFELLRSSVHCAGRRFVITTTNLSRLSELVGEQPAHEIIGKPYDLQRIVTAVHRALEHPEELSEPELGPQV